MFVPFLLCINLCKSSCWDRESCVKPLFDLVVKVAYRVHHFSLHDVICTPTKFHQFRRGCIC